MTSSPSPRGFASAIVLALVAIGVAWPASAYAEA